MVDFNEVRRIAYQVLADTETVRVLKSSELSLPIFQQYDEVLEVVTEIFLPESTAIPVTLFIVLPNDFPLVLPKIYLSDESRKSLGFLPHVNVEGFICVYDEESIVVNSDEFRQMVKICFNKAKQILEQGLSGQNHNDFSDEFVAYWSDLYSVDDTLTAGLSMLKTLPKAQSLIKFLNLNELYAIYEFILYEEKESDIIRFKEYLNDLGYHTTEQEALYLGAVNNLYPPFSFTNADIYNLVKTHFPDSKALFDSYVNSFGGQKLILFTVFSLTEQLMFGVVIHRLNTKRNGFRDGKISPLFVFKNYQRHNRVTRVKFDIYNEKRLRLRTDGNESGDNYSIVVAGLGSIGSNLIPYLMPIGVRKIELIDPDILTLENVNRHLLGLDYIGQTKVKGLYNYLRRANPLTDISRYKGSVIQYLNKGDIIGHDYLFIAIGKDSQEKHIFNLLQQRLISIPVFFIWIEPYLLGGHCLYIQPGHSINYNDLYTEGLYNYNVVDASEYKNPENQLQLHEAGCQGSYMPYGQRNITLFLSSLVSTIYTIIDNKDVRNLAIIWRSSTQPNIRLKLSDSGQFINPGSAKIIEL